jgi:sugar phosphate isomerase/epimerase/shikimate 5-dehydrogenase
MPDEAVRLGLIGDNIARSQAPRLHELAGRLAGIPVTYERLIPKDLGQDFGAVFASARDSGFRGLNITYPYKERVVPLVRVPDPQVAVLGAVNTVLFTERGPEGHNTDWSGFARRLPPHPRRPRARPRLHGRRRRRRQGDRLRAPLARPRAPRPRRARPPQGREPRLRPARRRSRSRRPRHGRRRGRRARRAGLVNCTPVGMVGYDGTPVPRVLMAGASWAFDAVYTPADTLFLRDAAAEGLVTLSGWELYFYQGLHAFAVFHGRPSSTRRRSAQPARARGGAMRFSIATVSLGGTLRTKLAAIAEAGFEGVEIFETDILAHDGPPAEVGRIARDAGLEIIALQPFRDFEGMPEPRRARNLDRARRKFDLMAELGAPTLLVCSNVSPQALGGIDRAADDLRALGEAAAEAGLAIGFEALAWGRFIRDWRDAWEAVRRADHPSVKLVLDSFHTLAPGYPVEPITAIPADRIAFVQLADAPAIQMDILQLSRHLRLFPGQGDLDIASFMAAVQATGFDGWISHEIFNDRFRMASTRRIAAGRRALADRDDRHRPRRPAAAAPLRAARHRLPRIRRRRGDGR